MISRDGIEDCKVEETVIIQQRIGYGSCQASWYERLIDMEKVFSLLLQSSMLLEGYKF